MSVTHAGDMRTFGRLLHQARGFYSHLLCIFLVNALATPLVLLAPVPLKIAVDSVIGHEPPPSWLPVIFPSAWIYVPANLLAISALLLVTVTALTYLQSLGNLLLQTYTGEHLVLTFRAALFRHVQRLSLSYHDSTGTTDSIYRIQYDAPFIQYILVNGIVPMFTSIATLAAMLVITIRLDWKLAAIAAGTAPFLWLFTRMFGSRLRAKWTEVKLLDSSANSVIQEVLTAVRVVKAFGREDHEHARFVRKHDERIALLLQTSLLQGIYDLLIGVSTAVGTALCIWVGVDGVRSGRLTVGELLIVLGYLAQIYDPLRTISKKFADLQSGMVSAARAFALLDKAPDVAEHPHPVVLSRAAGDIEFEDVTFWYTDRAPVLRDVSFKIAAGTKVGIQGQTGAGKSTLINLLTRFYDPKKGRVRLDGRDIREYCLADLRNQFSLVLQEPVLFSTSILENIAYARPEATYEQIVAAAKLANAHEFIMRFSEQYNTQVGERGLMLSGGERQRISLARAFLKDAPILLLDEPTSSVDVKTEGTIMEALDRLMVGRTVFMIAHRLSTLERCEVRLVVDEGTLRSLTDEAPCVSAQTSVE